MTEESFKFQKQCDECECKACYTKKDIKKEKHIIKDYVSDNRVCLKRGYIGGIFSKGYNPIISTTSIYDMNEYLSSYVKCKVCGNEIILTQKLLRTVDQQITHEVDHNYQDIGGRYTDW
jgi:hypothetical protein